MSMLILLYILVCHKTGLGVEWYDWSLFGVCLFANLVEASVRKKIQAGLTAIQDNNTEDFNFKDLFGSKEKK